MPRYPGGSDTSSRTRIPPSSPAASSSLDIRNELLAGQAGRIDESDQRWPPVAGCEPSRAAGRDVSVPDRRCLSANGRPWRLCIGCGTQHPAELPVQHQQQRPEPEQQRPLRYLEVQRYSNHATTPEDAVFASAFAAVQAAAASSTAAASKSTCMPAPSRSCAARMDPLTRHGGGSDDEQGLQQRAHAEPPAGQRAEAVTGPAAVPGVAETRHRRESAGQRQHGQVDPARIRPAQADTASEQLGGRNGDRRGGKCLRQASHGAGGHEQPDHFRESGGVGELRPARRD